MAVNNLKNVIALPVQVPIEIDNGAKYIFKFSRITVNLRASFIARWGEKELQRGIGEMDLNIVHPILYALLKKQNKDDLGEIKDFLGYEDEQEVFHPLAKTKYEAFTELFDLESCSNIILEICGIDSSKINTLGEDKKKELLKVIEELEKPTTPSSLPPSPPELDGPSNKSET